MGREWTGGRPRFLARIKSNIDFEHPIALNLLLFFRPLLVHLYSVKIHHMQLIVYSFRPFECESKF